MNGGEGIAPSHKSGKHGWNTAASVNDAQSAAPTRHWPTPKASPSGPDFAREGRTQSGSDDLPPVIAKEIKYPAPRTSDSAGASKPRVQSILDGENWHNFQLREAVASMEETYPTPTAQDAANNAGPSQWKRNSHPLNVVVTIKDPTPTSNPGRNETSSRKPDSKHHTGTTLHDVAYKSGGQLSPAWTEWLMNWPIGWTDLAPLSCDDFKRWRDLTLDGEWFPRDPADVIRSDISEGAKIVPRVSSGVKDRTARLKAIGNGQVPICAAVAFEMLTE